PKLAIAPEPRLRGAEGDAPSTPVPPPTADPVPQPTLSPQAIVPEQRGHPHTAPDAPAATHDIAALVDRLMEARAATATPAASVHAALDHGEFGQVSLHFRHEGDRLTVALASPDPDFRPAVQAALPTEAGASTAGNLSRGDAGRGEAWDNRGSGSHQREPDRRTPAQTAPRTPTETSRQPRRGIFV
ncbi:MAG: hypothetical protein ABW203_09115, partial [Novosphingobium sp.]